MRVLLSCFAALVLSGATAALAADVSGDITSLDAAKRTVTLKDGSVYMVPDTIDLAKFKVGEKVNMSYDKTGSSMKVTSMKAAGRP